MTYGSPKTIKDVAQYLKNVYGGKEPSQDATQEFQRRYKLIGGSPLIKITKAQALFLQKELTKQHPEIKFKVGAGMRFSKPFIQDVIVKIAKDADLVVGIIMSPQYSPIIMSGYLKELNQAAESLDRPVNLKIATDWHLQPFFLQALAKKVTEALKNLPKNTTVLFSAHSMPKRVIDKEPNYINDLKETAREVAKIAGIPKKEWMFCYQSAGHTPEDWLKPDFADIMPTLAKKKQKHVLIAPVQFLADHLEILYDVNIGARAQAEENGIAFASTKSLNTSPLFIKALAAIASEKISTLA